MVYLYKPIPKTIIHKGGWEKTEDRYISRAEGREEKARIPWPFLFKTKQNKIYPSILLFLTFISNLFRRELNLLDYCSANILVFYLLGEDTLVMDTRC